MSVRKKIRTIIESIDNNFVVCQNCFHSWEITQSDKKPYFCHSCGFDNKTEEFDLDGLKDWMKSYYNKLNESKTKTKKMNEIRSFIRKVISENYSTMIGEVEVAQGLDLSQEDLNEILKGYLEAAIWTEEERLKEDYEENYGYNEDEYNEDDNEESELDKLMRIQTQFNSKPIESFIVDDLEGDSKIQAYVDIKSFLKMAGSEAVKEAIDEQGLFRLGMDIWLTRNGHGSGFFDHSYEFEKELMNAGQSLKSVDLYITDNVTLAFSNA